MRTGWTRALVLVAVAALLGSVKCYGNCVTAACGAAQVPTGGCHHHKSSRHDQADCPHQHSDFIGPESAIAKIVAKAVPIIPVLTATPTAVLIEPTLLSPCDTGSPPHNQAFRTISVLRI